jgi:hypothetical protein
VFRALHPHLPDKTDELDPLVLQSVRDPRVTARNKARAAVEMQCKVPMGPPQIPIVRVSAAKVYLIR